MKASHKLVVSLAALVGFMFVAMAGPALAGPVQYTAVLKSGFSDSWHGNTSNNGLPVCAQDNRIFVQIAPGVFLPNVLLKHETGTMYGQGYAVQGSGPNASIMFPAAENLASTTGTNIAGLTNVGNGGAFARIRATCQVVVPPFLNPRLRSRTQFAGGGGPGVSGTLSANNGMDFVGASLSVPIPFFPAGDGKQQLTKGPNNFGGGLPAVTTGPTIYSSWVSSMNRGLGNGVHTRVGLFATPGPQQASLSESDGGLPQFRDGGLREGQFTDLRGHLHHLEDGLTVSMKASHVDVVITGDQGEPSSGINIDLHSVFDKTF